MVKSRARNPAKGGRIPAKYGHNKVACAAAAVAGMARKQGATEREVSPIPRGKATFTGAMSWLSSGPGSHEDRKSEHGPKFPETANRPTCELRESLKSVRRHVKLSCCCRY